MRDLDLGDTAGRRGGHGSLIHDAGDIRWGLSCGQSHLTGAFCRGRAGESLALSRLPGTVRYIVTMYVPLSIS